MGTKLNQAASRSQIALNGETRGPRAPLDAPHVLTAERIQARAYEIFQARNGSHGDPLADWLQAERELSGEQRWSGGLPFG